MMRRYTPIRLALRGVVVAMALSACGGSNRVVSKEDLRAKEIAEAQAKDDAERAAIAAQDAAWKGRTVGLEEPFQLQGNEEVKLESADWRVALVKTSWTNLETPKGNVRTGTAKLLVTRGEEMRDVSIEEGDSRVVLGFRIEVQLAHEVYVEHLAAYEPLAKLVLHRN